MKKFTLTIECVNDAFVDHTHEEIAAILRRTAARVESANLYLDPVHKVNDTNGNCVGVFKYRSR